MQEPADPTRRALFCFLLCSSPMKKLFLFTVILGSLLLPGLLQAQESGGSPMSGGAVSGGAPSGGSVDLPPVDTGSGGVVPGLPSGGAVDPAPVDPVVTPSPEEPVPAFVDRDCRDFASREDAQAFYDGVMSISRLDVHRLDRKPYDGIVCNSLKPRSP